MIPLKKRDRVLNGSQTQELGRSMGIQHFAKGSGVSHTELNKIISKNNAHPNRAFANEFSSNISKSNTVLGNAIKGLSKRSTTKYGNPWSTEVWRQMDNARGDGGGSGAGGHWAHNPGSGFSVTSGFGYRGATPGGLTIHDGVDFSGGRVVHAVHGGKVIREGGAPSGWGGANGIGESLVTRSSDGYYVIYQEFNGKNNSGAPLYAKMGQNVQTGQKIAALGSSGTHVHIGVSKSNPFSNNPDSTHGWFDITKLRGGSSKGNKKTNAKHSSALSKLVAKEIAPQLKWVGKHLKRSAGSIGSLGVSGSIESRAKTLYNAIKKAYPSATKKGIEAVLGNWEFESQLDPGISNSAGALGLGQWLDRGPALRRYAAQHHMSWKNAGAQIDFALHGDGANSAILKRVLRGNGSVSSLATEFSTLWERGGHTQEHVNGARKIQAALHNNGGWSTKGKLNVYGEKDPEIAINPKKPNADNLIGSAISARSKTSNSVFSNESQRKMHKALLENLRKYNPLKNMPDKHQPTSGKGNNVTVNLNMNITVNANDKNAGTKVANDISKQVNEQVQAIFGNLMAKREGGFI
ncbi:hypothetical protein G8J22_01339 [Lentilactobacillus hilgardii]|uniref:phage tail tip lysozyme n=1 Tax=Lentilactobacillus hilgardii TaxID=1588 RepID=UPI00019C643B|nr:phage tail tip lysozyme [Lentilactobacillus hilgardii]EEI18766.1 peptidase, M23 family [Lentilactobacillus buchneri ATCC 11577]QIR09360.1 hypothetical protein G8J22_01339 [Lentilactobacillus hilgardii]